MSILFREKKKERERYYKMVTKLVVILGIIFFYGVDALLFLRKHRLISNYELTIENLFEKKEAEPQEFEEEYMEVVSEILRESTTPNSLETLTIKICENAQPLISVVGVLWALVSLNSTQCLYFNLLLCSLTLLTCKIKKDFYLRARDFYIQVKEFNSQVLNSLQ